VAFNDPVFKSLALKKPAHAGIKNEYPCKKWLFYCCWLL